MNCLDCLDRTNTVQSFLALEVCPRPRRRPACALCPVPGPSAERAGPSAFTCQAGVASPAQLPNWAVGWDVPSIWGEVFPGGRLACGRSQGTLFMHLLECRPFTVAQGAGCTLRNTGAV